ncbi:MAG: hypothetical protein B7733_00655 [Myxococcales bacterium FL481]|nr:MAG: hypothetical protein B7733_00655 [Myxococcales bacterium FL481]
MPGWEVALRSVAALMLIVGGADLARRCTWWILGATTWRHRLPLRWALTGASGMWLATVAFHGLYPLGGFRVIPAVTTVVVVAGTARWLEGRWVGARGGGRTPPWSREVRAMKLLLNRLRRAGHGMFVAFFVPPSIFVGLRCLLVLPTGWDTMTYHGVRATRWVQNAGFTYDDAPGAWNLFRHYFAGAEVLFAWSALPMHSDLFIAASTFFQWWVFGLGMWACARALDVREPFAGLWALAWCFAPPVFLAIGSGYVELAMVAGVMAGLAACLHFVRRPTPGLAAAGSMAMGVAAGVKLPGLLPAAVTGGALAWIALWPESSSSSGSRRPAIPRPWRSVAAWAALMLAPVIPWLVFNVIETGSPLSPAPLTFAGLTLGVPDPAMAWFQDRGLEDKQWVWAHEWPALLKAIGDFRMLSFAVGPLVVAWLLPLPICLPVLVWRRPAQACVVLGVLLTTLAFFYLPGMAVARLAWPYESGRYLLVALLAASAINLAAVQRWRPLARFHGAGLTASAIFYAMHLFGHGSWDGEYGLIWIRFVSIAASIFGLHWLAGRISRSHWLALCGLAFVVHTVAIDSTRVEHRSALVRHSYHLWPSPRYHAGILSDIDDGRPYRIAVTGGVWHNADTWASFPLHGVYMQNDVTYVPITADGDVVHFDADTLPIAHGDDEAWVARLRALEIDFVMSFHPSSLELQWMAARPDVFERRAGEEEWGFFRVRPGASERGGPTRP